LISPREHVNSLACEFTYRFDHYRLASSCRPAILSPQHIVIRLPDGYPPVGRDLPGAAAMLCASTAQVPSTLITAHIVNKLGRI
jgi:hypothetical protein